MNDPSVENEAHGGLEANAGARQHQQELATLNLFRLLETAVQGSQFKLGGRIVVRAQDVVGLLKSARASFEDKSPKAVLELNQAAESFRSKVVRWESEARALRSQRQKLSGAQKRQLQAEIAEVQSKSRKTNIFFERLATTLTEWAAAVAPDDMPTDEETTKQEAKSDRDRRMYVATAHTPEAKQSTGVSTEGLTMMTLIIRQQFDELMELFHHARDHDVEGAIQSALDAFKERHYVAARSRLKSAHQVFVQAATTRRIDQAELAEERFETLLQGHNRLVEATTRNTEDAPAEHAPATGATQNVSVTPVQDLRTLQTIMLEKLDKVFPHGVANEQGQTATKCMERIISGPLSELHGSLKSLLRAMNYGADNNARETNVAKEIIKRLGTHTPEEIRPRRGEAVSPRDRKPLADADQDDGSITLDFALTSNKCFPIDPRDMPDARSLKVEFRNTSTELARVRVQIYDAADKPLLPRPKSLTLPATSDVGTQDVEIEEPMEHFRNQVAATVEFMDLPEEVEITQARFSQG